jgi:hypothetical protein
MEKNNLEQRYAIRFCVNLGEGATGTNGKVQKPFGNGSVSRTQVFRWCKDFVNGREMVQDELRPGRCASVGTIMNVDRVRAFIRQDRRLTIRMISDELILLYGPPNCYTRFEHEESVCKDGFRKF